MNNKREVRKLIGEVENPVIFEIGAGDFLDTAEFVETFKDTKFNLYAFEPDQRNLAQFESRINDSRVHLFKGVIGNVDGIVDFNTSTKNPHTGQEFIYSSSLRRPGKDLFKIWPMFIDEETCFEKCKVESITLDTFVRQNRIGHIDYIYADTQGCEDIMIEGGMWTLNNITRYLYTEYNNQEIYYQEPSLTKILSMLPNFETLVDFGTDILLKNKLLEA